MYLLKLSVCESESHAVMSDSLLPHGLQDARLLCPWNSPGQNTGEGSHSFTRESSQDRGQTQVSLCRMILYHLNHQGSPETLCLTQILFSYILFQVLGYPIKRLWEALLNPSLETSCSYFQLIIYLFIYFYRQWVSLPELFIFWVI